MCEFHTVCSLTVRGGRLAHTLLRFSFFVCFFASHDTLQHQASVLSSERAVAAAAVLISCKMPNYWTCTRPLAPPC